jgi:hypothetical protein
MHVEKSTQQVPIKGTVPSTIIAPEQLYDPLLVLFKVKLRLNNWWAITGMGVITTTGLYGWLRLGTLTPLQILIGSIVVPLWMGIYLFLPSTIADLFNGLWRNGVIGEYRADRPGSGSYKEFVEKQARWIHSRWWVGVAFFVLALYWLSRFFFLHDDPIKIAPLWLQCIMIFVFSLVGYVGVLSIVWLLSMVVSINRLFHVFTIRVRPLHPDGSGGLGLFNRFLWISIALVMIGVCSVLPLSPHSFNIYYILGAIVGYLITLPLLLTAWLAWPHHMMVQARNELLQPLIDEYEQAISETMPSAKGDTEAINAGTERLAALQKRYEQVRNSFPTWPIEIVQLRRLAIVLILPLLLSLLPLLLDVLTKK